MAYSKIGLTKISTPPHSPGWLSTALGKSALKTAFGAAVPMVVLGAGQAQALVVNVGGQNWNVTTFTGTYNDNANKFNIPPAPGRMPWWGNDTLANSFATAVGNQFGIVNPTAFGPFFGVSTNAQSKTVFWVYDKQSIFCQSCKIAEGATPSASHTWAQADLVPTPTPGPLPALGAAAAFGFSRKLRKRIKTSKSVGDSFTVA